MLILVMNGDVQSMGEIYIYIYINFLFIISCNKKPGTRKGSICFS